MFIANDGTKIINFPTKHHWKYPSKLVWIKKRLEYFVQHYKEWNIKSIAFPKLGTNAGKLPWSQVKAVMVEYLKKVDISVYICLDELEEAEGIEREMIRILNEEGDRFLAEIKLRRDLRDAILKQMPIKRLKLLQSEKKISNKTYEKLFIELYNRAKKSQSNHYENLSFFDR
ncbi:macro domain-containing protein [Caldicellulosiruptor kronotskyensis]|uniref:macro domain-containing protein n=1 Tax=Caldicellulosiruptor kronotskyensis TaxID=413889 RepID=UPI0002EE440C|nr:macro domain-containing protein [Caldicellulosiruptor kronotskyensis]